MVGWGRIAPPFLRTGVRFSGWGSDTPERNNTRAGHSPAPPRFISDPRLWGFAGTTRARDQAPPPRRYTGTPCSTKNSQRESQMSSTALVFGCTVARPRESPCLSPVLRCRTPDARQRTGGLEVHGPAMDGPRGREPGGSDLRAPRRHSPPIRSRRVQGRAARRRAGGTTAGAGRLTQGLAQPF